MLRQNLSSNNHTSGSASDRPDTAGEVLGQSTDTLRRLDIQQSLNVLEELILESPRVPFSRRTLVDEDQILEQLDRIRLNLPTVFQEALQIVQQRDRILSEAHQYAREMVTAAEQEAARRMDDLGIVQQAEAQARQIRQQLEQDCDALRSQTQSDIDQWQAAAQQYWENLKQQTEIECENLRREADNYAAEVLQHIEQQLTEMMRVVHNGRRSLSHSMGSAPEASDTVRSRETPAAKPNGSVSKANATPPPLETSRINRPPRRPS